MDKQHRAAPIQGRIGREIARDEQRPRGQLRAARDEPLKERIARLRVAAPAAPVAAVEVPHGRRAALRGERGRPPEVVAHLRPGPEPRLAQPLGLVERDRDPLLLTGDYKFARPHAARKPEIRGFRVLPRLLELVEARPVEVGAGGLGASAVRPVRLEDRAAGFAVRARRRVLLAELEDRVAREEEVAVGPLADRARERALAPDAPVERGRQAEELDLRVVALEKNETRARNNALADPAGLRHILPNAADHGGPAGIHHGPEPGAQVVVRVEAAEERSIEFDRLARDRERGQAGVRRGHDRGAQPAERPAAGLGTQRRRAVGVRLALGRRAGERLARDLEQPRAEELGEVAGGGEVDRLQRVGVDLLDELGCVRPGAGRVAVDVADRGVDRGEDRVRVGLDFLARFREFDRQALSAQQALDAPAHLRVVDLDLVAQHLALGGRLALAAARLGALGRRGVDRLAPRDAGLHHERLRPRRELL